MAQAISELDRAADIHATARGWRDLRGQDRQGRDRIDWDKPWNNVTTTSAAVAVSRRVCELGGDRVKVLRSAKGEGSGAPGTVLDDRLTIACTSGAVRIVELQKAGAGRCGRRFPAGTRSPPALR